jgi:hypothetical protein
MKIEVEIKIKAEGDHTTDLHVVRLVKALKKLVECEEEGE